MKSALFKDIIREIKRTKSRFFSIFAIIALGAGFFSGLKAACPDMLATQEAYFRDNNLMDIHMLSTYGFDDGDIEAIRAVDGIRGIYPTYSKDVFVENDRNSNLIAKMIAIPDVTTAEYADKTIDEPVVLEGRMPQSANECVVEKHSQMRTTFKIGDTVSVYTTDSENPLSDSLVRDSWTVVGIVMNPQYISYERGNTTIGDGSIDTYIMIPESNFCYEVYTDVYLTMEDAAAYGAFDDGYWNVMDGNVEEFEAVADVRKDERFAEIKEEAEEKLADAKQKLADGEKEANEELSKAKQELDDAYKELTDGEKKLADGKKQYNDGREEYNNSKKEFDEGIADAELKIEEAQAELDDGYAQYNNGVSQLMEGLESSAEQLRAKTAEIKAAISAGMGTPEMEMMLAELERQLGEIEYLINNPEAAIASAEELRTAKEQLDKAAEELSSAKLWLGVEKENGQKQLDEAAAELSKAYKTLRDSEKQLADGWDEYNDGLAKYEEAKAESDQKLADARQQILDAEKKVAKLKKPTWYVFTRKDNPGFSTYESDAYRIENVCKIFPVFFFLVAILVCLTTMTRMVEEERTQIGTLKALGYSKAAIASKFIVYSALASLSGSVVGIAAGSFIFPTVIYSAYEMLYKTPALKLQPMPEVWVLVTLCALVCTTAAALMACMAELRSNPAALMRPKAPKAGKRVLLEKIPFIWKRLSFTRKVTVRNLFRYKKRIFMTILGIAGCTALTMAGFGIYSSISVILDKQYSEIFNYDLIVVLDSDAGEYTLETVDKALEEDENTTENVELYMKSLSYKGIGDTSLVVAKDTTKLADVVKFNDRVTGDPFELTDDGVIITERFAELSGLSAGDEFTFTCGGEEITAKVSAVTENYTLHFVYMTENLYEKLCGAKPSYNTYFTIMKDTGDEAQKEMGERLMSLDGVQALSFVKDNRESFGNTVKNLNYVVILIIVSAAMLAFVVLYNLTNINITERIREIATIKVLGFYDNEVSAYVFRENILLTLIGDAIGLGAGVWLHRFVIQVAQTDSVMFGRTLPLWCFAAAFVLTLIFALLVDFIMHFRLKKVSMVESLKSVE